MLANAVVLLWLVRRSSSGANSRERRDGVHGVLLSLAEDDDNDMEKKVIKLVASTAPIGLLFSFIV